MSIIKYIFCIYYELDPRYRGGLLRYPGRDGDENRRWGIKLRKPPVIFDILKLAQRICTESKGQEYNYLQLRLCLMAMGSIWGPRCKVSWMNLSEVIFFISPTNWPTLTFHYHNTLATIIRWHHIMAFVFVLAYIPSLILQTVLAYSVVWYLGTIWLLLWYTIVFDFYIII